MSYLSGHFCPNFLDLLFWNTKSTENDSKSQRDMIHIPISEKINQNNFSNLTKRTRFTRHSLSH